MSTPQDTQPTVSQRQKWATALLAGLALAVILAAGFRPKGEDAALVVQRTFEDVDVPAIIADLEGQPISQEAITGVAAYRAMCQRTLAILASAAKNSGSPEPALERVPPQALERLEQPAQVARGIKDENLARVFELLSKSIARGEVAPAADFVTTQCDASGTYLDKNDIEAIGALDMGDRAFANLIAEVTERPDDDGEDEAAEPDLD